jgi:hypothetical protein
MADGEQVTQSERTEVGRVELRWDDVTPVFPKVAAGLLAGGVLVFNGWFAGIFNGNQPYHVVSWQFPLLLYIQAVIVAIAMTAFPQLFYDVTGGLIAGVLLVGLGAATGAVTGKFNTLQFVAQVVVACWAGGASLRLIAAQRNRTRKPPATGEPSGPSH